MFLTLKWALIVGYHCHSVPHNYVYSNFRWTFSVWSHLISGWSIQIFMWVFGFCYMVNSCYHANLPIWYPKWPMEKRSYICHKMFFFNVYHILYTVFNCVHFTLKLKQVTTNSDKKNFEEITFLLSNFRTINAWNKKYMY